MKKSLINEIRKFQKIAGILKESQDTQYKFKVGQTVESYGNEIMHKILDVKPDWKAVKTDPVDPENIMRGTEDNLDSENRFSPWYLVEPLNKEEDGDYSFWWPENELTGKSGELDENNFYAPDYVAKKYGDRAKEIESNIHDEEDNNPNIWDLYTSLETPQEVDEFVQGFLA